MQFYGSRISARYVFLCNVNLCCISISMVQNFYSTRTSMTHKDLIEHPNSKISFLLRKTNKNEHKGIAYIIN